MGLVGHGAPDQTGMAVPGLGSRPVEPPDPEPEVRINWLFSGVLLGAGSWLLLLGVIFAAIGSWVIAGALFGGVGFCALAIWRASRRLAAARPAGHGRHRAMPTSTEAA
jgi:hypothetical protein